MLPCVPPASSPALRLRMPKAGGTPALRFMDGQPTWKSAIQQVGKPALRQRGQLARKRDAPQAALACVVLDQPQQVSIFGWLGVFPPCGGWSATPPRSIFRRAV